MDDKTNYNRYTLGRLRLLELSEAAIATLAREMTSAPNASDRIKAANSILDRVGFNRSHASLDAQAHALYLQQELRAISLEDTSKQTQGLPASELTPEQMIDRARAYYLNGDNRGIQDKSPEIVESTTIEPIEDIAQRIAELAQDTPDNPTTSENQTDNN